MIKAEDLRIGDLVRVSETGCMIPKGEVCKVVAIDSEKFFEEMNLKGCVTLKELEVNHCSISCGVWCKYIFPIPLTPEILEKNGWSKRHDSSSCDIYSKGKGAFHVELEQCIYNKQEGFRFVVGDSTYLFGNKIKHVHKLQHILWALGEDANLKI